MIGALSARRKIVVVNAPVTPTFTAPAAMTSVNSNVGSGEFTFQFNSNKRTCATNTTGSVAGSGASSFTYFGASDLVNASDYEVMVTLGTNAGFSNITTAGGSATLGIWISLDASPLYRFSCSGRRGGSRPITVAIRHKISTGVTASTVITMTQSSDAVVPSLFGLNGTTLAVRTVTDVVLGIYVDSASPVNIGAKRVYKSGVIDTSADFGFATSPMPESEYEIRCVVGSISPSGSLVFSGGSWVDIGSARSSSPPGTVGSFSSITAGIGTMTITVRHKLDNAKAASASQTFEAI